METVVDLPSARPRASSLRLFVALVCLVLAITAGGAAATGVTATGAGEGSVPSVEAAEGAVIEAPHHRAAWAQPVRREPGSWALPLGDARAASTVALEFDALLDLVDTRGPPALRGPPLHT